MSLADFMKDGNCPGLEALEANRLKPDPGVAKHLEACASCQAEYVLLSRFQDGADAPMRGAEAADLDWIVAKTRAMRPSKQTPWWHIPRFWAIGFVTSVALLAALVVPSMRQDTAIRQGGPIEEAGAFRSQRVEITSPKAGDSIDAPARVQWEALQGAASYEVCLNEVDGVTVWKKQALPSETGLELDEAARRQFLPFKTLFLVVRAKSADGAQIAESSPVRIRRVQ